MENIIELIDKRQELTSQKEQLEQLIADVDHEIMSQMLASGAKQALGTDGTGYSLTSTTRYDFSALAYRALEEKGLLDHFRGEPKITKTKLEALQKDGVLDPADYATVWAHAIPEQSPYALRRYVPKEAKVFA